MTCATEKKLQDLLQTAHTFAYTNPLFLAKRLLKVSEILKFKVTDVFCINYRMIYCPIISVVIVMSLIRTILLYCFGIS